MKKVVIFDSGSGGCNVLAKCVETCPYCDYIFCVDDKNGPYGDKSKEELEEIGEFLVRSVLPLHPDIIIFGCNTLTATAIEKVRELFPEIIFIGSEPALKPAFKEFDENDVLILATNATIKHCKIIKNAPFCTFSPKNLPKIIDENLEDLSQIVPYLKDQLQDFSPKAIVLGCTHFEGIKKQLKQIFPSAKLFDSSTGIAKRLASFCEKDSGFQVQFMSTSSPEILGKMYHYFKSISKL